MGGKKGGGSAHVPYEAPNTLYSKQRVKVLDVLSEGPVEGLSNGNAHPFKSLFFNDTPVQAKDGSFNFFGFNLAMTTGEKDQTYLPGFDVVEKTNQVNADLKKDTPITRSVTDPNVSGVRVTVGVKGLVQSKDNGDRVATSVSMQVSLLKNGNIHSSQHITINEKGTESFYQDVKFNDLPEAPFDIRVSRLTEDSKSDKLQNATIFPSYVEIIDAKLSYKHLSVAGYEFDAMQFGSSLPRINTLMKLLIVSVPTNYDPINRTYTGMWDGSFKKAWSDNPAWAIYDFATNKRYGGALDPRYVNRAALYRLSQFCDELVDDGYGGKEPRVRFNAFYTSAKKFDERLQDMASSCFGLAHWDGQHLTFSLDRDDDPVAVYTNANVIDGNFSYEGISHNAIVTDVHVQYNDAKDAYRQKVEVVEDIDLLRRYPRNTKKVVAEGCTSRSQAHRMGRYILEKSRLQNLISFAVGREGLRHRPHDVIQIADIHAAGANIGGRILEVNGKEVTLDREVEKTNNAIFSYVGEVDGKLARIETKVASQKDDYTLVLEEVTDDLKKFTVFNLARTDVKPKYYRALGISDNGDGTYSIKAVEHEMGLQDRIASGIKFEDNPNSIWTSYPEITNGTVGNNGDEVVITWDNINADTTSLTYMVKLFKDGKIFKIYPDLKEPVLRFDNLPSGTYVAEIQAKNNRGQLSNVLKQYFDLNYTITALQTKSELFSVKVSWTLPTIVSTDVSTEIWRAEKDNINDARLLVTLPYPQNEHVDSGISVGEKYYYWARIIDKNDTTGEFTRSMLGEPKSDPDDLLNILDGAISEKQISKDLQDQFDKNIDDKIKESETEINKSIEKLEADDVLRDITLMTEGYTRHSQDNKLEANVADAFAQIKETNTVIVREKEALAQKDLEIEVKVGKNTAEINRVEQVVVDEKQSQAIFKEEVNTKFNENEADAVLSLISQSAEGYTRSQQDLMLSANVADAHAEIEETKGVIAEEKKSQAEINTTLTSKVENNTAQIKANTQTQVDDKATLTQQIESANSKIGANEAEINQIKITQVDDQKAISTLKSETSARFDKNEADQVLENISLATEGYSRASQYSVISVSVAGNSSSIEELSNTFSDFNGTMSEKITQLQSKTENHQSQITQISSTQAKTDGKVNALWTIKVDANGAIGGIMLGSDGKESQFKVAADSFIVSTGNQEKNLFVIQNVNGQDVASLNVNDFIINGTLDAKMIKADTFEGVKIKGVEINAGKFYGGSIAIGGTTANPNFNVDSNGNLYAKNGTFEGTVLAKKIKGGIVDIIRYRNIRVDRADIDSGRPIRYYFPVEDMDYIYTMKPFLVRVSNGNVSVSVKRDDGALIGRGVTGSGYWSAQEFLINDFSEVDIIVEKGTTRYVDISMVYSGVRGSYTDIKEVLFQRIMRTEAPITLSPIKS